MKTFFILFIALGLTLPLYAATAQTQEIRGRIIDKSGGNPIPGATISLNDSQMSVGTLSDENGEFRLWNVPSTVSTIRISLVGYKSVFVHLDKMEKNQDNLWSIELESKTPEKKKLLSGIWQKREKQEDTLTVLAVE